MQLKQDDDFLEEPNDSIIDEDEDDEITEAYSYSSDDDLDPESSGLASSEKEDGDVTNILMDIDDSRMRYKVYTIILFLRFRAVLQSFTCKFMLVKKRKRKKKMHSWMYSI